ncbi:MAG: tetratricopeptide repeat protein [Anaerolineae bacterium]
MQRQGQATTMSAEEVRKAIRRLEIDVVNYRGKGREILDVLDLRDDVEEALAALEITGLDVRPEQSRLAFVDGKIDQYARKLLREIGGPGVMAKAREERLAPSDRWWWFLDQRLADRLRRSVRRAIITVLAIVVVVGGGLLLADRLWGLSPEEKEAHALVMEGERMISEGELEQAIETYEQALSLTPNDPEVLLYLGMLYEETGQQVQADETYAEARRAIGDDVEFYVSLAQIYVITGKAERVIEAANEALALDEESARAYYVRATGYEMQNELALALEDLDLAAELSREVNDTLYVMAKTRYANLLERAAATNR